MKKLLLTGIALIAFSGASQAYYQPGAQGTVQQNCGTANYPVGSVENITQNPSGSLCVQGAPIPDETSNSGNITAADTNSTEVIGYNSVPQYTGTPTIGSSSSSIISGQATVTVQLTGTWTATVVFETSSDNGITWIPSIAMQRGGNATVLSISGSGASGNGSFLVDTGGATNIRVRATSYTSGPVIVHFDIAANASAVRLDPNGLTVSAGSPTAGQGGSLVMGASTGNPPTYGNGQTNPLSLDTEGNLRVTPQLETSGGWQPGVTGGLLSTPVSIKSAPGLLGLLDCYNPNSSPVIIELFNVLPSNITLGTTLPVSAFGLSSSSSEGYALAVNGLEFTTAISIAAVTAYNGTTAPALGVMCSWGFN